MQWLQEIEEKAGVEVEWEQIYTDWDQTKSTRFASGDIPDILINATADSDYATYKGLFMELTDLIDQYAPNVQAMFEEEPDTLALAKTYEGEIYALPKFQGKWPDCNGVMFINKTWLDNLGLEVPTTKQELIDDLYAIHEKYPDMIPWSMGGRQDTEKMYLNFVGSYVTFEDEKDEFTYSENYIVAHDGALDGIREMNQLYNDGIIVQDFATDTDESVHKSNIAAGKVAFFLDDNSTQWENIHTLNNDLDKSTFVPVECFTQENGDIRNVYEQMYGMWIMVPAASEDKVEACMTYLNWLADPTNAENVAYTPEHEVSKNGVPVAFTADELSTMGYKGTLDDYNIVNKHFAFQDDEAGIVESAMGKDPIDSKEWYENFYETVAIGKYRYPVFSINAEAENEYGTQIRSDLIEYVYRLISCKPDEFDSLEAQLKSDMDNAGLTDIIEGRAALYDEEMAAAE
jgi:putative aldouronate transport system substrate-binding protein